ncbi:phage gp6-like head-tail connector protein [Vibrio vulnificus]|nr:phage gp6-like head-tail connector protein [Vibrio vulnificus]
MHFKVIQKHDIAEEFIPLSEIQEHCRIFDPHEDGLLEVYRLAAIDVAEQLTNRAIGVQSVQATFDSYKARTYLPFGTIRSIASVTAMSDNDIIQLPESDYRLNPVSNEIVINSKHSKLTEFIVSYEVGYEVSEIPHALKIGMLKLIATWFENREDVSNGVSVAEIPFNHQYCFNLYRINPF